VAAGAGTATPRTGVQRRLRTIDAGCSIENILQVTLTVAAAAEMRARIR
jgi:ATP-dependent exoDNAse (exonuclease V) beta subunit